MDDSHEAVHSLRTWRLSEISLVFLIFFIDGGAAAPHVNEAHYLTKAKHYWNESYCPGDLFLDSADPHLAFYWTVGWLTKFLPLTAVAWIGRVAAWGLLASGWQRLSAAVVRAPWASALSAALWVTLLRDGNRNFAGEWVVGGVEAKCFAYGFFLFGMAALVRGDWRRPWIWFGAASAFHVLVGAWAVLAALAVWLTERRDARASIGVLLPGLMAGGLLALIGLVPSLALEWHTEPAVNAEAARIYVYDRLPHHLAPLTLPEAERRWRLFWLGGMSAALVGLWQWLRIQKLRDNREGEIAGSVDAAAAGRVMRFAAFALGGALAGLAIELALDHHRLLAARVLRYYWFRQVDVALPMALSIVGVGWVVSWLRSDRAIKRAIALAPAAWAVWFLGGITYARWQSNEPPALKQVENPTEWREACQWIAEHAPVEAMFLVPRSGHSFKWYASRGDAGTYKDVPQDAANVVAWRSRMRELFPKVDAEDEQGRKIMLDSPELLGTDEVQRLAEKYGATHVLARSSPSLDLPLFYSTATDENGDAVSYSVYAIEVVPTSPP